MGKEQLAVKTRGLSIQEIEEAQSQIQRRMRETAQAEAWSNRLAEPQWSVRAGPSMSRPLSKMGSVVSRQPHSRTVAHSAVNRRRRDERIQVENSAFLRRLES